MANDSLPIRRFNAAFAGYVAAAVKRANADGNPYLTKAEAKNLPPDLQDNFEAYRARTLNGVVTASHFVRDQAAYAAGETRRADLDGDWMLNAREIRLLPEQLQDNVSNFLGVAPPTQPGVVEDVSLPLSPETLETVRSAFVDYVENALTVRRPSEWEDGEFEYDNAGWGELVREYGGDGEHEALKAEMLKAAKNWSPDAEGWETRGEGDRPWFTGHFEFVRLFVELEKGKAPSFNTEVD